MQKITSSADSWQAVKAYIGVTLTHNEIDEETWVKYRRIIDNTEHWCCTQF